MKIRLVLATVFAMGLIYLGVTTTDSSIETSDAADSPSASDRPVAANDPQLQTLRGFNAKIRLEEATLLMSDDNGSSWVMPSDGGEICLVRSVREAGKPVGADLACKPAGVADAEGIILGAPGQYYGYAPRGASVVAKADGAERRVTPTASNGFKLPSSATEVSIGGREPMILVQPAPSINDDHTPPGG